MPRRDGPRYGSHRGGRRGEITGLEDLTRLWTLRLIAPQLDDAFGLGPDLLLWLLRRERKPGDVAMTVSARGRMIGALRRLYAKLSETPPPRGGATYGVVGALAELIGLDALETDILLFAVAATRSHLGMILAEKELPERELHELVARVLDAPLDDVRKALAVEGALRSGGLVMLASAGEMGIVHGLIQPSELVVGACAAGIEPRRVIDHLVPRAPEPTCTVADFAHLGEDLALLQRHLSRLLAAGGGKLQVLVHGAPGVGKSELVRALAVANGAALHEVRFEDAEGNPLDASERLLAYRLVQRLLGRTPRTLLVFEEIEDLFPVRMSMFGAMRETPDMKALTNRTLEQARVPTFFLSNEIDQMDPAVLRRFDYVLHMGVPPRAVRQRMLAKHVGELPVREAWLRSAAERADMSPAAMERATRFVRGLGVETAEEVEAALDRLLTQSTGQRLAPRSRSEQRVLPYDMSAVRTDVPLAPLIEGLRREKRGTVLFAGPPGTGKTEAAQAIAEALERPLHIRAASQLLSKWLGETEKNLARAFDEAREQGAVLLLDEIDSFLQSRERAQHSWETTQVNELLVQIERFDGIVIATTNFATALDRAAMRRFAVKVTFSPPGDEQKWALFEAALHALELSLPSEGEAVALRAALSAMPALAPGHFAAAVRGARLLRQIGDADALLAQLAAEHSHEPDARRRAGFA